MTILVIAEHNESGILHTTRSTITAANQIENYVHLLVAGGGCAAKCAQQATSIDGVSKVLVASDEIYANSLAENLAALVVSIADGYTHILAPSSTFGKDFMPRVAALLDVSQISDIIEVKSADTFVRPIYAGNALATVQSSDAIKIITVRSTAFDKAGDGGSAEIENISIQENFTRTKFVELQASSSDRPDLTAARIVVSGGRGVGSGENFDKYIYPLADKLGAAVGASRVAVDSGYVSNDLQVGQTGKIVAPDLYIAVGISGAIQHLAGMKDSKVIVAINKDENAPIFEIADYGLVADLFEAIPEFESELSS